MKRNLGEQVHYMTDHFSQFWLTPTQFLSILKEYIYKSGTMFLCKWGIPLTFVYGLGMEFKIQDDGHGHKENSILAKVWGMPLTFVYGVGMEFKIQDDGQRHKEKNTLAKVC